jgi:hypothetical protein
VKVSAIVILAITCAFPSVSRSAQPTVGDLLVTNEYGNVVREYTRDGTLVQAIPVPYGAAERPRAEFARDLVVTSPRELLVFNGTFAPSLSVYDAIGDSWTHHTNPGWSTVNNVTYGGIAVLGRYVYVTSDLRFSGDPSGIVRFDRTDWSAVTFQPDLHFIDLTIGRDGLLYGLHHSERSVSVFDPNTMEFLRFINLAEPGIRGIAVDEAGQIFAASENGLIFRFDPNGSVLATLAPGAGFLGDIDLSASGDLAAGAISAQVVLTDTAFTSVRTFPTGDPGVSHGAFLAFVEPPSNQPPDCSAVRAVPGSLRPANGHFRTVRLAGANDPDGDAVTVTVDGVTQDETVGRQPDARLAASGDRVVLRLRAERLPRGDGRVYRVAFTAADESGGECSGAVTVEVRRHNRKPAVDSAPPSYDSFTPAATR